MGNTAIEKLPPQALEAEQAVLGAMLLSREAIDIACEQLVADDFYRPAHRRIFKAIIGLYEKTEAVDLITVSHELVGQGQLEEIGGRAYLAGLTEATPGIANIEHHCRIVSEKSALTQTIDTANLMLSMAYDQTVDIDELLEKSEQQIFAIKEHKLKQSATAIGEHMHLAIEHLQKGDRGLVIGLPSGFTPLDALTGGFRSEDMIIIGARPSVGKTALALNIADHISVNCKVPGTIFSLEMSKEQLATRLLCSRAYVSSNRIINNRKLSDADWVRITDSAAKISEAPIFVDDSPSLSALEIRAKARRMKARENIGYVIIDYAQQIMPPKRAETREQEVAFNSRSIKSMARELKVPVIVLAQLNRQVELRGKDARPQLSDLRESGALEADADVIIFIHRPRNEDGHWGPEGEFILAKQRNGPTGNIDVVFIKDFSRFELREFHHEEDRTYRGGD